MLMSRGLRPISFWVNETEKLWAQLGVGREIHGGILLFVCFTLPLASKHYFVETAVTTGSPAPL